MKRKIKCLLLSLLPILCLFTFSLALSSCDLLKSNVSLIQSSNSSQESSIEQEIHQHEWSANYSYNEENHWTYCKTCNKMELTTHYANLHEFNECMVCQQPFGITYEISPDGEYALVSNYYGNARKVCIAETYQDLPVKMICNEAFDDSYNLTTVILPKHITTIEDEAFRWCYKLTEVINHSPFISVEKGAETNGYVGFRALSCFNSDDVYQNEFINDNGFIVYADGDEKLLVNYVGSENSLVIPNYITKIHANAFEDSHFSAVKLPESVTSIGEYAFKECSFLTEITIPDSVLEIGDGAFRFCYALHTVRIGNGVQRLGNFAFHDCKSLTSIHIPEGITSIGVQTFMDCESLTYINVPDSVSTISEGAFWNCKSLTSILIGKNVTLIRYGAFGKCENLQTVFYNGTQENCANVTIESNNNENYLNATPYFYLDEEQTSELGNYWSYDENGLPVIVTIKENTL